MLGAIEARLGPLPGPMRAAFLAVDRVRFVRPCDRAVAYQGWPLPLDTPHGEKVPPVAELLARHGTWERALFAPEFRAAGATVSAPLMYALSFHLLGLAEGQRMLELGSGTGYGAALAAHIVGRSGRVTSVEVDPHLVRVARALNQDLPQVQVLHADGLARADLAATHDRVWLTFSVAEIPRLLVEALPEGAVLLAPVGPPPPSPQRLLRFERAGGALVEKEIPIPVWFLAARGLIEDR
ncbi:MAG TPA: methyltransferase domain-containing protein [Polyangia bacterium]|nr:methyltransferase domain-containing protein [Polyangia bacterium]